MGFVSLQPRPYIWFAVLGLLLAMTVVGTAQDQSASPADQAKEVKEEAEPGQKPGIEAVLDQIEQSASSTDGQIARVIAKMRDVQSRMTRTDTGRETQQVQKQILADLDSLIQAARRQQQRQRQQQQNSQQQPQPNPQQSPQQQPSDQQKPSDQQQPSESTQPSPDGKRTDGQEQATQTSQAKAVASQAAQRKVILQQVWGHLPERLRERVLNMKDDKYLPKYEDLIRKYFEALAEKGNTGSER